MIHHILFRAGISFEKSQYHPSPFFFSFSFFNRGFGVQSTLSKVDTLWTKVTVRFREVSTLERAQVT